MAGEFDLGGRQQWPTMFFFRKWQHHDAEGPGIVDFLYQTKAAAKRNIASGIAATAKSAQGLYESEFDLLRAEHPGLRKLGTWIAKTIGEAVCVANGNRVKPEQVRVEIPESWSHITNAGGFHDAHYHAGCSWCGMYYVRAADARGTDKTGAGNGVSRFYSPIGTGGAFSDYGNAYLSSNRVDITPVDGMLLLFPSYLLHSGLPYTGQHDRIVIAFNSRSYLT